MQVLLLDDPDSEAGVDQANAIYSHDEDVGESSNLWWYVIPSLFGRVHVYQQHTSLECIHKYLCMCVCIKRCD